MNKNYAYKELRVPIRLENSSGGDLTSLTVSNILVDMALEDDTVFTSLTATTDFTLEELSLGQYWLKIVKDNINFPMEPGKNYQIKVRGNSCPTIVTKNYSGHINKLGTFVIDGIKGFIGETLRIPARFEDGLGVGVTGLTHSAGIFVKFAFESDTVYDTLAATTEWTLEELSDGDYFIIINSSLITKGENWTCFVEIDPGCPVLLGPSRQKYSGHIDTKFKNGVFFDPTNGTSGQVYPTGERSRPASVFSDAIAIAKAVPGSVRPIIVLGDVPTNTTDIGGFTIIGEAVDTSGSSTRKPVFTMGGSGNNTTGTWFKNLRMAGTQGDIGGQRIIEDCEIATTTALLFDGDHVKNTKFEAVGDYNGESDDWGGTILEECDFVDATLVDDMSNLRIIKCTGKLTLEHDFTAANTINVLGFIGEFIVKDLHTGDVLNLFGIEGKLELQATVTTASTINIWPGNYTITKNQGGSVTVNENLPTNIMPQLLLQNLFTELRTGVVGGSYFDIVYPVIADAFDEAGGATSQVMTALAANTSFQTGQEFAVIFTNLESGTADTKRDGAEFLGAFIINQDTDGDKKVWEIIGGYRMDNDGTPVIVTASKFGICFGMDDADLFSIPAGSPRWSGATDTDGEDDRTEAGWTFVVKQSLKTDGASPTFPASGEALQIRTLIGGFTRSPSTGGSGDATLANQTEILSRIGTPTVNLATDIAALPASVSDAVWDEAKADHVASGSFGEAMQLFWSALGVGKSTMDNDAGDGNRIKRKLYNYAESAVIRTIQILKPDETDNTAALDTNAMAGTEQ